MTTVAKRGGHDVPLCGATKKQGEGNCTQVAGWGVPGATTGPCKLHGGATRNHRVAAERASAREACELFGLEMADRDPGEVLLTEITRTRRSIQWHETEAALLMLKDEGDEERIDRLRADWRAERKHLADVTTKALSIGVARRHVELKEDIARQWLTLATHFAKFMGWDPAAAEVKSAARRSFELLEGEGG